MTDYSDLVKRLQEHAENMYVDFLNEAADAIDAQAKRIEELEASIDKNDEWAKWFIEKTDARIAKLEAALKPFADEADEYEGLGVQDKDKIFVPLAACRQARKALGEEE